MTVATLAPVGGGNDAPADEFRKLLHLVDEPRTPPSSASSSSDPDEDMECDKVPQSSTVQISQERYIPRSVVHCSPETAFGEPMREYIESQVRSPKKQWIYEIIRGEREVGHRLLETADFVLTPDIDANGRQSANWLAIFTDPTLRTIRDLRGRHVGLLRECRDRCLATMEQQTGYQREQIMCYFHYLPSVFQLHLHVCAPYGQYTTPDILKVHPIDTVISNLEIDPLYYRKATITTAVICRGALGLIYRGRRLT